MGEAYGEQVEDFKKNLLEEAEDIANKVFPRKIIELEKIHKSDLFKIERMSLVHTKLNIPVPDPITVTSLQPPSKKRKEFDDGALDGIDGTRVMMLPEGKVPCNAVLVELTNKVKPEICELIEHCNKLKMWIQLLIPKIEDGNNFGVSVQEETLSELRQVESEVASYLDQISRYFITRGKLITKVAKYPHVEDYRRSIKEIDEKEFLQLRLTVAEVRNTYMSVYDLIAKNKEKIKKPRNSNADAMY